MKHTLQFGLMLLWEATKAMATAMLYILVFSVMFLLLLGAVLGGSGKG